MFFYEDFLCLVCGIFECGFGLIVFKFVDIGVVVVDYMMVVIFDSVSN